MQAFAAPGAAADRGVRATMLAVVNVRSELPHRASATLAAVAVAAIAARRWRVRGRREPERRTVLRRGRRQQGRAHQPAARLQPTTSSRCSTSTATSATLAPLGVEDDWDQLVSAYETASTVVIGDQESEQAALTAIYSSEKSAAAVEAWLIANCAVDIGPVFTIVPQGPGDDHRRRRADTADRHPTSDIGPDPFGSGDLAAAQDDLVDEAVVLGLLGGEPAVALGVGLDLLERSGPSARRSAWPCAAWCSGAARPGSRCRTPGHAARRAAGAS